MKVLRIRVTIDQEEDIYRDIDIKLSQSLEDFHFAILKAYNFDTVESASFFTCNNIWQKSKEFVLKKEDAAKQQILMKDTIFSKIVVDPHQKFIYIYDYKVEWFFYCEIIKIVDGAEVSDYPLCTKSYGDAPRQRPLKNIEPEKRGEFSELDSELDKMFQSSGENFANEEPNEADIAASEDEFEGESEETNDDEMYGFDENDFDDLHESDDIVK